MKKIKPYVAAILSFIATFLVFYLLYPLALWMFVIGDNESLLYDTAWIVALASGIFVAWYIVQKNKKSELTKRKSNLFIIISIVVMLFFAYLWISEQVSRIDGSTPLEAVESYVVRIFPDEPLDNFIITEVHRRETSKFNGEYIEYDIYKNGQLVWYIGVSTRLGYWWGVGKSGSIDPEEEFPLRSCESDEVCQFLDCSSLDTPEKQGYNAQCVDYHCDCVWSLSR